MELILFSYIADLIFGDPRWFPHPVRLIGRFVCFLESLLNGRGNKNIQRFCGIITSIIVVGISGATAFFLMEIAKKFHPVAYKIIWIFLAYTTLSVKDLAVHAHAVWKMLSIGDLDGARSKLSLIVTRDTQQLSEDDIIRATVETVAENTTDGIISPIFYLFLGGPVVAIIFKAISTLDSMIGYKNERYIYFGWAAAKLDTIANFIPACIAGFIIPTATFFCGRNFTKSLRIMLKDGRKHDSIISGISEAAMAGALEIRLGGICSYFGKTVKRPYLGEDTRQISLSIIKEAIAISIVSSALMLCAGILFKTIL